MDKIDTLILDDDGIDYVHKYYKKIKHSDKAIPPMKNLICIHALHCDYCNSKSMHTDFYNSIQEYLNCGVQICNRCLANHNHQVSFLENSINKLTISWWQFIKLNNDFEFIRDLDPFKSIGIGFGKDKEPPFDELYIDVSRVIKLKFESTNICSDIKFPVYLKFSKLHPNIFKDKNKYITLDNMCSLNSKLDKNIILNRINRYLVF